MKIKVQNYTFDKANKQITFTDYATIKLDSILLITNVTYQNTIIYNFASSTLGGTVATNVLTLTYNTSAMANTDKLQIFYEDDAKTMATNENLTVTKAVEAVTDWTQVAQNTVAQSAILSCVGHSATLLHIQAALDTTTAHAAGTRFAIQVSSNTTGNEDWQDYTEFIGCAGTALTDVIENNPLATGATSLTLTSVAAGLVVRGKWLFIKDGTIADSEMGIVASSSANALVLLEGTTNQHALNTPVYGVTTMTKVILIDKSVYRLRLIVDNTIVAAGSTICYKLRATKVTSL